MRNIFSTVWASIKKVLWRHKICLLVIIFSVLCMIATPFILWEIAIQPDETMHVRLGKDSYTLEVANSALEQEQGLQNRKKLPDGQGMIFEFKTADIVSFWMKNTLMPLDMVWVNQGVVVGVTADIPTEIGVPDAELASYASPGAVDAVIELPAGSAAQSGIIKGVELTLVAK